VDFGDITGDWDHGTLPPNVRVGPGCFIERRDSFQRFRSTRDPGLVLGADVVVHTWAEFNVEPGGALEIGEGSVLVGPVFMCAERISVGRRVVISYQVTIADSDFHPLERASRREDAIANAPGADPRSRPRVESRPVVIEDDVWIGIGAIVLKGVRIGRGARVAAGAVVTVSYKKIK
jgi:acetyltransferase-like isoleucine patch superfamily enzyme